MTGSSHCHNCLTRRQCLAAGLQGDALTALSACVHPGGPMKRGDFLYRAGESAGECFVVRSGAYKTILLSGSGDEHVTGFHFPGDLLGMAAQATGSHRESAIALETSTACRMLLADLPALWRTGGGPSLLRLIGDNGQRNAEDHMNLSRTGADARVAGFLSALSRRMQRQGRDDRQLPLPMSRTDMANYLGMSLECLSRVLARFSAAGLVTAGRTHIDLNDIGELRALAGHIDF